MFKTYESGAEAIQSAMTARHADRRARHCTAYCDAACLKARLACELGQLDVVRAWLSGPEPNVNWQDAQGYSMLMMAASHRHLEIVRLLVAHPKINLNLLDQDGRSALWFAVFDPVRSDLLGKERVRLRTRAMVRGAAERKKLLNESQLAIVKLLASDVRCHLTIPSMSEAELQNQNILLSASNREQLHAIDGVLAHYAVPDDLLDSALSQMVLRPKANLRLLSSKLNNGALSADQQVRVPREYLDLHENVLTVYCAMARNFQRATNRNATSEEAQLPWLPLEILESIILSMLRTQNGPDMRARSPSPVTSPVTSPFLTPPQSPARPLSPR